MIALPSSPSPSHHDQFWTYVCIRYDFVLTLLPASLLCRFIRLRAFVEIEFLAFNVLNWEFMGVFPVPPPISVPCPKPPIPGAPILIVSAIIRFVLRWFLRFRFRLFEGESPAARFVEIPSVGKFVPWKIREFNISRLIFS